MKLKFFGAAGSVTGSCFLLTANSGDSILIDCGMFQGSDDFEQQNFTKLDCDCAGLLGVVVTHAHLDHCGRLPLLPGWGFNKTIWMTAPSRDIAEISLLDAAKINTKEEGVRKPLYEKLQVEAVLPLIQTVHYGETFSIGKFDIRFYDAGHILGAACLEITDQSAPAGQNRIVFSGDLGNTPQDLIRPTEHIPQSDYVVMESTYGDRMHPQINAAEILSKEINAVESSGGALLVPAFAVERTQELLHLITHLKLGGKVKAETPVFVDSPMASRVTEIFGKYPDLFNAEFQREFSTGNPFDFPGLTVIHDINESRQIDAAAGAKVIIAGSGMMAGGRILNHAVTYLPLPTTRLLFVGYQADATLGREILRGGKQVSINGSPVTVEATVTDMQALSSHADQGKLLNWLKGISGVKKVMLTHGDDESRVGLSEKIKADFKLNVEIPAINQKISLGGE